MSRRLKRKIERRNKIMDRVNSLLIMTSVFLGSGLTTVLGFIAYSIFGL